MGLAREMTTASLRGFRPDLPLWFWRGHRWHCCLKKATDTITVSKNVETDGRSNITVEPYFSGGRMSLEIVTYLSIKFEQHSERSCRKKL